MALGMLGVRVVANIVDGVQELHVYATYSYSEDPEGYLIAVIRDRGEHFPEISTWAGITKRFV